MGASRRWSWPGCPPPCRALGHVRAGGRAWGAPAGGAVKWGETPPPAHDVDATLVHPPSKPHALLSPLCPTPALSLHLSPFVAALTALVLAQVAKVLVHHAITGDWEPARCLTSGGMPSSHTAAAAALAASLAVTPGPASDAFAVAAVLAEAKAAHRAEAVRRREGGGGP